MFKIKEGEEYLFKVEKELTTTDNTRYYVLSGPDKRKFLLPAEYYSHYGLSSGKRIRCRIDKINCKGEIYLEPKNPHYTEGKSYFFNIAEITTRSDISGDDVKVIVVTDRFGNKIPVPCTSDVPKTGTRVKLEIEKISKGRLFLVADKSKQKDLALRSGRYYEFLVEKIAKGLDNEDYFIIRDPAANTHTLSRNYYEYYGLKPGQTFRGKVVKYRQTGEKIIEPVNPYYKTGAVLLLKLTAIDRNVINNTFTLDLTDKFGFTHCVETPILPRRKTIHCKVVMIKKGKPLLRLM